MPDITDFLRTRQQLKNSLKCWRISDLRTLRKEGRKMIDEKKLIDELKQSGMIVDNEYGNTIVETISNQPKIGEWIPCNERLPEEYKDVLVWYEYFHYGDYNKIFQTYGIGYHVNGLWGGDVMGKNSKCMAWQPLPEPYIES